MNTSAWTVMSALNLGREVTFEISLRKVNLRSVQGRSCLRSVHSKDGWDNCCTDSYAFSSLQDGNMSVYSEG